MAFASDARVVITFVDIIGAGFTGKSRSAYTLVTIIEESACRAVFTRRISAMILQVAMYA